MRGTIIPFLITLTLVSCSTPASIDHDKIKQQCAEIEQGCSPSCQDGKYKYCYVDTAMFGNKERYDVRAQCHGVHVGSRCKPCSNLFSLNFGGAMREVSCPEFFEAIERQNQECGGCMKKVGEPAN